eukprot:jgi/Botrbrau1/19261/Bobra.0073s0011.1
MGVSIQEDKSRLINPMWVRPMQSNVDVTGFGNVSQFLTSNDLPVLSNVAYTGEYGDLKSSPNLQVYATSNSLTQVAFTGDYANLINKPNLEVYATSNALSQVAFTGDYANLINKPNLQIYATSNSLTQVAFTGDYANLINTPNLEVYALSNSLSQVATTGSYLSLSNTPNLEVYALSNSLSQVATTGSYLSLSNTPNLSIYAVSNTLSQVATTGDYANLLNAPNLSMYALSNSLSQSDWLESNVSNLSYILNKPSNVSSFSNDAGFIIEGSSASLTNLTITGNIQMSNSSYLVTQVSPVFNGSFWSIGDNPIERPSALSEALKIGGYIFDGAQILWDGAQQAQLMFNQGAMADKMAADTATDVAERLNDPENELTINWSAVSQKPLANQGISQDIGIAGGLFMDGSIYLDGGASVGLDGGVSWRSADRSKKILDVGAQRINLLVANTNSLLCNTGLINTLTSADIISDNVVVHGNLVSQGKLVANTGTFNSILSNLFTVSTFTTAEVNTDNVFITANLVSLGNASFLRANIANLTGNTVSLSGSLTVPSANITSLVGQTATLTGNLTVPSGNITSLQTANLYVSNVSYLSNSTLVAPSVQTANLYVSNVSYLSNSTLVAPSVQTANLYVSNVSYLSNSTLVAPSVQTANLYVSNVSYLSNSTLVAPSVQTANLYVSNVSYLSNSTLVAPSVQTANLYVSNVSYLSNSTLVAPSVQTANLYVSNVSYLSNSTLVAPSVQTANLYVSNVSYLSNSTLVAPSVQTANLYVSNVSYLSNSTLVAPSVQTTNLYVSNVSYLSNSTLVAPSVSVSNTFTLGNSLANSYIVMGNGQLSVGNAASNTFGFSSVSASGIISNSLSVSNGAYVINNSGIFQRVGNTYTTYNQLPSTINIPGNITSNSVIISNGVQVNGNITASFLFGNASQLTGLPPFSGTLNNNQLPTSITISGNITSNSGLTANSAYIKGTRGILNVSGADPGHMLVTSYTEAVGDVYGIGQYSGGAVRVFHSNSFTPAFTAISSYRGNNVFTDILVVRGNTQNVGIGTSNPTEKLQVSGNVSATFFKGNGSLLTGITGAQLPSTIGVNTLLANTNVLVGATASLTGALVSGITSSGNLTTPVSTLVSNASIQTAGFFIGDGSFLSNINSSDVSGTFTNNQLPSTINIPGNITSNSQVICNGVQVSGNVSANYLFGNASQLTGYNNITASGTVQAAAFSTSGAVLTTSNFFGNISQCTGFINSQLPSTINIPGAINSNSSITTTGNISTPLFINAGYFFGNGSQLTGLTNTQLPANITCNVLTVNSTFQSIGATTLSGLFCGNVNLSRGVGFGYRSITNADTITANVGAFPGWCQANTYWLASTQAWGGASGVGTSTYMVCGNLGASSYFGGTTTSAMPIILANCSIYTWGFLFGDGGYVSNIRGTALQTQINNNRLPTNVNIGGTLQANALVTMGNNLQFSSGAYIANPGVGGNGMSVIWGGATNQSSWVWQSDTNVVAYNKSGVAVWATGAINSDGRFKKNIRNLGNVSSILRNIKPRKFKYNDDMDREEVGFLVEEVQPFIPEIIQPITNPDTGLTNNLLRYEKMTPYLIQAFQELDERITALEKSLKK